MPKDEQGTEAPFLVRVGGALDLSLLHYDVTGVDGGRSGRRYQLNPGSHLSLEIEFKRQRKVIDLIVFVCVWWFGEARSQPVFFNDAPVFVCGWVTAPSHPGCL